MPLIEVPLAKRVHRVDQVADSAPEGRSATAQRMTTDDRRASLEQQIAGVLSKAPGRVGASARPDLITLRCKRLARMYRELRAAGAALEDITAIEERHANILLTRWREQKRSPATIRSDWSILRVWCETLGKPRCVGTLKTYWPDAPRASIVRTTIHAARHRDEPLLAALEQDRDRTHYFVERLCQSVRLSVQEALLLPVCAPSRAATDSAPARKLQAAMNASPAEVGELLASAAAFVSAQGRTALIWTGMELSQAMRRHENRLAYLRRKRAIAEDEL